MALQVTYYFWAAQGQHDRGDGSSSDTSLDIIIAEWNAGLPDMNVEEYRQPTPTYKSTGAKPTFLQFNEVSGAASCACSIRSWFWKEQGTQLSLW